MTPNENKPREWTLIFDSDEQVGKICTKGKYEFYNRNCEQVDVIEYSAYEALQKELELEKRKYVHSEIEQTQANKVLKEENEKMRGALLKISVNVEHEPTDRSYWGMYKRIKELVTEALQSSNIKE